MGIHDYNLYRDVGACNSTLGSTYLHFSLKADLLRTQIQLACSLRRSYVSPASSLRESKAMTTWILMGLQIRVAYRAIEATFKRLSLHTIKSILSQTKSGYMIWRGYPVQ